MSTRVAIFFLCCLLTDSACADRLSKRGEKEGELFSRAIMLWRYAVEFGRDVPEFRKDFCRSNVDAPVSWRFVATDWLPGTFNDPLKDRDAHWKSSVNKAFRDNVELGSIYTLSVSNGTEKSSPNGATRLMALRGKGTAFNSVCSSAKLEDLAPDCIVLCEVRASETHWMQPRDLDIAAIPRTFNSENELGISSNFASDFFVAFADGQVWLLKNSIPFKDLESFFTNEGAKRNDREALIGKYAIERISPFDDAVKARQKKTNKAVRNLLRASNGWASNG